jgi:hypothetical protein
MGHDVRLTVFWVIHLVMLGLFGVEILFIGSVWLKARVPGLAPDAARWRKLGAALLSVRRLLFSRRVWILLRSLVSDGMLHQRLYRRDLRRWAVHISVFGAWLLLGILSTVTGVVVEILPLLGMSPGEAASIPLFGDLFHADVWWVAFVNEILGLVVIGGMLFVIYRRYIEKDPQLRTLPADTVTIALLTLIAFSGFPCEVFRLLSDYTTAAGTFAPNPAMLAPDRLPPVLYGVWAPQWGFAGYHCARILGGFGLSPDVWSHFAFATALLYYLPFSRFFHVIMSPVIVAYNTMTEREMHGKMPQATG